MRQLPLALTAALFASPAFAATTPPPVVTGTTAGTFAAGNDGRFAFAARMPGLRAQFLGDSRACNGNLWTPAAYAKGLRNPLEWAEIYSNGRITWDPTIAPPAAVQGTVVDLKVLNGGSGYTAPAITIPYAAGFAATGNVTNGAITSVTVTSVGAVPSNYVTKSNVTVTDATGSGAVLTPVIGGDGTFCASGTQLDEILARLGDVVSQKYGPMPDILVVVGGTNAWYNVVVGGNTSVRTQLGYAMQIIQQAAAAGMRVVWLAENPKNFSAYGANSTTTVREAMLNEAFNSGLRLMAAGDPTLNPRKVPFLLVDMSRYQIDTTTGNPTSGGSRPGLTIDNLHWSNWGAAQEGWGIEQALRPFYQTAASPSYSSQPYDPIYNPHGNLLAGFTGAGGVLSGLFAAPSVAPAGWGLTTINAGSVTGTFSASLAYPTPTAPDARGLVIPQWTWTINANANGTTNGQVSAQTGINVAQLNPGDVIRLSCEVSASGFRNINDLEVQIYDNGILAHQGSAGGAYTYLPPATDLQVGSLPPAGAVTPSRLFIDYPVSAASISGNKMYAKLLLGFDASASPASTAFGAAPGAAATVTWSNCQLTKTGAALIQ